MTTTKKIPALRFPEFEGEWEEKKIEDISKDIMYGLNSSAIKYDGTNKYIRITDIDEESREFQPKPLTSPDGILDEKFKVKENDILFTRTGASVGKSYLYKKIDGNLFFAGFLIKFSIIKANSYFVYAQTLRENYFKWVETTSTRTGQPGINAEEYKLLKVNLPSLDEQKKIASFLTAVDDKIQQLTKKKALLEQYKKGVMKQIFNQQIRFKDDDGNDYPDWEEKTIGSIFSFILTNSFSRSLLNYKDGEVKNIHYGDIHTKFKSNFNIEEENVPFINADIDLSKYPEENFCKEGDLIIADASEDYNDIGKAIEIINLANQKLLAGLHTYILRDENNVTAKGFKGYLMQIYEIRLQMMKLATGISVLGITKGNLSNVKLNLPCKKEQGKIADFITALDKQINAVNKQLEQTQQYKKGLLQQMFV